MTGFVFFADRLSALLQTIIASDALHAQWLNTLSYLENCGARKIARCEHPTLVKEEVLKHASEEFRHAHYLKKQIGRVSYHPIPTYSKEHIFGGFASLHYLAQLDLQVSRFLSQFMTKNRIKETAYLLVTYAIECRAGELYRIYDRLLKNSSSRVTVKSILLEEKEHLEEMREGIAKIPDGAKLAEYACICEGELCRAWLDAIEDEVHRGRVEPLEL